MAERPILFSAPMVRAILAGKKTETRRIVTVPWYKQRRALPYEPYWVDEDGKLFACDEYGDYYPAIEMLRGPEAGDRLWVKEAIRRVADGPWSEFIADGSPTKADAWPWKPKALPGMFMPRGLRRIELDVAAARIERLQAIDGYAAQAEGIDVLRCGCEQCRMSAQMCPADQSTAIMEYAALWDSLHNEDGCRWADNPWVRVVTFRRYEAAP